MTRNLKKATFVQISIAAALVVLAGGYYYFSGARVAPQSIKNPSAFTDNFNSGRLDGWSVQDEGTGKIPSRWSVANKTLTQKSEVFWDSPDAPDIGRPGTNLIAGNKDWENYDFSVRFKAADNDAAGVVFRFADKDNYYRFSLDSERKYQRLVKKVNGTYTLLAQKNTGYTIDQWYTLRVVAVGEKIQVFVDGQPVFSVNDHSLTKGKLGLYTWANNNVVFDDVKAMVQNDSFFTVAVVPDTQYATQSYPDMMAAQMKWLAENRADNNVVLVLQEGDVVDKAWQPHQWSNALTNLGYLSGKLPYVVAAGNHDIFDPTDKICPNCVHREKFNSLISRLGDEPVSGRYVPGDFLNTYYLFSAGGVDMLVLNLEFGANDKILNWAGNVVKQFPGRHAMLVTHDYLGPKNKHRGSDPADTYLPHTYNTNLNNGIDIWNKFVRKHPNVQFVFNGHVTDPVNADQPYSVGRLVSTNDSGRRVFQTLTNFQSYSPAGQGFLRLFKFYPSKRKVDVITYSPYIDAYLTDPLNQFTYDDVDLAPWAGAR